jgi:outer membrane protein assembly factor BamE (lipoprotein component of BamABCDE complex)
VLGASSRKEGGVVFMRSAGIFLALAAFFASGCAVLARQQKDHAVDPTALAKVHRGMPKEEVTRLLGAPTEIVFSNKALDPLVEHAYIYEHSSTHYTGIAFVLINFGNVDEKRDRVVVWLDPEGRVEHVGESLKAKDSSFGFPFGR